METLPVQKMSEKGQKDKTEVIFSSKTAFLAHFRHFRKSVGIIVDQEVLGSNPDSGTNINPYKLKTYKGFLF
jgi:hypothetical protein